MRPELSRFDRVVPCFCYEKYLRLLLHSLRLDYNNISRLMHFSTRDSSDISSLVANAQSLSQLFKDNPNFEHNLYNHVLFPILTPDLILYFSCLSRWVSLGTLQQRRYLVGAQSPHSQSVVTRRHAERKTESHHRLQNILNPQEIYL